MIVNPDRSQSRTGQHRVSVVVPSYNHARFLLSALESVTRQTYTDYDITILDDASTDGSVDLAQGFMRAHPEIPCTVLCNNTNQGGVITLNTLIENTSGEYIALINSDDVWAPEKLAQQVAFLDVHPDIGAVFTQATIIDDDSRLVTGTIDYPADIFLQKNRSRGQWLRKLFYQQNCLCHPSILIRRSVYQRIGLYNPRLRQLPDMEMWVRLLKHTGIHVIESPLVSLRFHRSNTSRLSNETITRNMHEISFIAADFFENMPGDVLTEGFGDLFRKKDARTPDELSCEKAFLYFTPEVSLKTLYNRLGLQQLYQLMGNPQTREVLGTVYRFDYPDFFQLDSQSYFEDFLTYNRNFLVMNLRRYPLIYVPLLKFWRFIKRKRI